MTIRRPPVLGMALVQVLEMLQDVSVASQASEMLQDISIASVASPPLI